MLRLSIFCMLLSLTAAQNGYDYKKPDKPFGSTSSRPGYPGSSGSTTTPYPLRPQTDDKGGPTTGYPTGPLNYPASSQRPGLFSSSYPSQGSTGPLRLSGKPSSPEYSGGPGSPSAGPGNYPSRPGGPWTASGSPGSYDSNYPQGSRGPSGGYFGQGDSSYPQGSRGPFGDYPGQGDASYPQGSRGPSGDQGGRYPGQPGSNFENSKFIDNTGNYEGGDYSAIPGEPYTDYPILSYIPETSFNCDAQQYPGYYADVETRCQVFHICANNKTYDFLCPNGTVFSQEYFVCVWWNQFTCETAPSLYELNAKLYDYSKTGASDFPGSDFNEYYSGGRGPQGSSYPRLGNSQPNGNYPNEFRPQGPTTSFPNRGQDGRYPGTQSTFGNIPSSGSQGPFGNNPSSQRPFLNYPGSQGPSGSYPGSQRPPVSYPQGPSGSYPNSQGPSGSYSSSQTQGSSGKYPGAQGGPDKYPGTPGAPGKYQGSQGPSGSNPNYGGPGSNGSGPQGQSGGPGSSNSRYPSSTTPYPGTDSGNQGYPSGKPNGPSFPGGNGGRKPPTPNREYLPPKTKRALYSQQ